jgi:hypothetical protein
MKVAGRRFKLSAAFDPEQREQVSMNTVERWFIATAIASFAVLICLSVLLVVTSSDTVPAKVLHALSAIHSGGGTAIPHPRSPLTHPGGHAQNFTSPSIS